MLLFFFAEIYYLLMENYTLYVENDANIWNKRDAIVNILYLSFWLDSHKKYQNLFMRAFSLCLSRNAHSYA